MSSFLDFLKRDEEKLEEICRVAPDMEQIEILGEKVFKSPEYDGREDDQKRILKLKKNIGVVPRIEVVFLNGHTQLFARTSLDIVRYKVSKFYDTILPCVTLMNGNTSIHFGYFEIDRFDEEDGKRTVHVINNESSTIEEMQKWYMEKWHLFTKFYSSQMDFSIYTWIKKHLNADIVRKVAGGEIIRISSEKKTKQTEQANRDLLVTELLARNADPGAHYNEALLNACKFGHDCILEQLTASGVDPTAQHNEALLIASLYGQERIVEKLLALGANPAARRSDALSNACMYSHEGIVEKLIEAGADPKAQDSLSLMIASSRDNEGIIDKLIAGGADPKAKNSEALFNAKDHGHKGITKKLIAAGADPKAGRKRFRW